VVAVNEYALIYLQSYVHIYAYECKLIMCIGRYVHIANTLLSLPTY